MKTYFTALKNLDAPLTEKITIYVPTTLGVKGSAPAPMVETSIRIVQHAFSLRFGGCTTTEGTGCYTSDSGELVTEKVYLVSANTTPAVLEEYLESMIFTAQLIKRQHKQEAVSLEVNGELYFV